MSKYAFTEDMAEISGFGGGYESTCRAMVAAGLEWFDMHPDAVIVTRAYQNVFGVIVPESPDAKSLSATIVAAAGGDCTGAMHHGALSHIRRAKQLGWDAYCAEMRGKRPRGDAENAKEVPT